MAKFTSNYDVEGTLQNQTYYKTRQLEEGLERGIKQLKFAHFIQRNFKQ